VNVLVTGDMGHLGQRISWQLSQSGHAVQGYDKQRDSAQDIGDTGYLEAMMQGYEIVVHAAAIPHPDPALSFASFYYTNVEGTYCVLEAAEQAGVRRVVFLSSIGYYGVNRRGHLCPFYFPIDEAHPIATANWESFGPLDEYNQSKVMAEQLLAYYGSNQILETVALRIGPANSKATQYPPGFDWSTDQTFRRDCFFANCDPDYAAAAVVLAVEAGGPFWYEPFNVFDRYTHESVDVAAFLQRDYPSVEIRGGLGEHACLFSTEKAEQVLGFQPCEELR